MSHSAQSGHSWHGLHIPLAACTHHLVTAVQLIWQHGLRMH